MKVFVLGGYGKTGIPAIQLLAQSDLVTEIAVVGRNLERAEKSATEIGEKAIAVHADGTDEQMLISLMAGYDIVMNAAYNETVLPTIRAAIHTRTHYCDVAWGDILEGALQLAPEAKTAGITSIVATGISPCISNLMGVYVAHQFEQVEQLQIGRAEFLDFQSGRELTHQQWLKDPKESLAALHEFRPFIAMMLQRLQKNGSRKVCVYRDGQWDEIDPIKIGLDVPLAGGGTITSYPFFSGDDRWGTLSNDLSTVSPVEMWFSPLPLQLHNLLREHALRMLGGHIDSNAALNSFYDTVDSDPHHWLTLPDNFVAPSKLWVTAVGRKEGRAARCRCWFTPPMWNVGGYFLTSVALVVAVRKILRGEIQERGVMTAEKAFDPLSFINEVAASLPDLLPDGKLIDESFEWLQ